jgi:hypothetical protein
LAAVGKKGFLMIAPCLQNLSNVAVPGTGVPLSYYCYFKVTAYFLIFILYPFYAFLGAYNVGRQGPKEERWATTSQAYRQHLLAPEDW